MNEVEIYIKQFEPDVQEKLNELRQIFFEVLPNSEESIRYKMPAYKVGKHHLYFAAYKKHIGFDPFCCCGSPDPQPETMPPKNLTPPKRSQDSLPHTF
jgi:uncharacterized protein YdhG (YjbR/CyaY superfamily)